MVRRAVARATFGTALEWFDFALYGVVAATISEAVLSVARPDRVAGELLGGTRGPSARRGDLRHARRNLMLVTVSVMGPSSFLMGLFTVTSSRAVIDPQRAFNLLQSGRWGGLNALTSLRTLRHERSALRNSPFDSNGDVATRRILSVHFRAGSASAGS
ncbi:hypothetical protein [Burkholderia cepacia]